LFKKFEIIFFTLKGSLSISFISGKLMFRGVHYVTTDYMLYIQDGWITFAYWKPQYQKKDKSITKNSKDPNTTTINNKKTARLNIFLCNFQLHYYNSFKNKFTDDLINNHQQQQQQQQNDGTNVTAGNNNYETDSLITEPAKSHSFIHSLSQASIFNYLTPKKNTNPNNNDNLSSNNQTNTNDFTEDLMQLFSVVNIRIQKGRVFAGNSTLPSTLSIRLSTAKMELVTEKAHSKIDEYCFLLKGDLNKLEVSLIPNRKILTLENRFVFKKSL
jgi:hypothetical protein